MKTVIAFVVVFVLLFGGVSSVAYAGQVNHDGQTGTGCTQMTAQTGWSWLDLQSADLGIRDRDRLHDGSCTTSPDQVKDHLRTRDRIHQ